MSTIPITPKVRTGQPSTRLSKDEFLVRWRQNFYDPAFEKREDALTVLGEIAWEAYNDSRKSPRTRKAGPGFADPEYELSVEWLEARDKIIAAQKQHETAKSSRVLLICASPRTDQSCPSEMSKTFRLTKSAEEIFTAAEGIEVDLLDLSVLAAITAGSFTRAKPASRRPCRCVIGRAPVIRTITWAKPRIG